MFNPSPLLFFFIFLILNFQLVSLSCLNSFNKSYFEKHNSFLFSHFIFSTYFSLSLFNFLMEYFFNKKILISLSPFSLQSNFYVFTSSALSPHPLRQYLPLNLT